MTTTISNAILTAEIKHAGAELCSLIKRATSREYMWQADPKFWAKHSPILFPIVGTLKDNSYTYNDAKYVLSRHGFARDLTFDLIDKKEDSATFSLHSNETTLEVYPFAFELQVKYSLESTSLKVEYIVINNGEHILPFSIGAHPAFSLPLAFDRYGLEFEKEEKLSYHLLENNLLTTVTEDLVAIDRKVALHYTLFERDALIFKTLQSNSITIIEETTPLLAVHYKKFPNMGIWTMQNAPFLCIEPWYGYSDTMESSGKLVEKEAVVVIASGTKFETAYSIEIL